MARSNSSKIAWLSPAADAGVSRVVAVAGQQGVAQRRAQPVEHAGGQQEPSQRQRQLIDHLGRQVVGHQPVAAGEGRHERGRVGAVAQRQGGQLQAGRPALGARHQRRHLPLRQAQPHARVQELGGLLGSEAQVGGAHLGQLAAGAQARQRQRRILAGGEHQVDRRRQMLEQEGDGGVDGRGAHQVVVVQHQQARLGQGGQVVDQAGEDGLGRRRGRRGVQPGQRRAATGGGDRLEGGDQVAENLVSVLVALVEREPGDRVADAGQTRSASRLVLPAPAGAVSSALPAARDQARPGRRGGQAGGAA